MTIAMIGITSVGMSSWCPSPLSSESPSPSMEMIPLLAPLCRRFLSSFLWIRSARLLGSLAVGDAEKAGVMDAVAVAVGADTVGVGAAGLTDGAAGLVSGVMLGV